MKNIVLLSLLPWVLSPSAFADFWKCIKLTNSTNVAVEVRCGSGAGSSLGVNQAHECCAWNRYSTGTSGPADLGWRHGEDASWSSISFSCAERATNNIMENYSLTGTSPNLALGTGSCQYYRRSSNDGRN